MFWWLILFLILFILARIVFLIWKSISAHKIKREGYESIKTAIIIGSGGHTSEILRLIHNIDSRHYNPRIYIMACSDVSSEVKIHNVESTYLSQNGMQTNYTIVKIPRSRKVSQSYITSVFTTLYSLFSSLPVMLKHRPELILCNGPGTCIPICLIGFMMKALWITNTTIIFIESICRVESLSLSGKILLFFADEIFVQWAQLQRNCRRTRYVGRLV